MLNVTDPEGDTNQHHSDVRARAHQNEEQRSRVATAESRAGPQRVHNRVQHVTCEHVPRRMESHLKRHVYARVRASVVTITKTRGRVARRGIHSGWTASQPWEGLVTQATTQVKLEDTVRRGARQPQKDRHCTVPPYEVPMETQRDAIAE